MLTVAVGHSDDPDSALAIAEVLDQCLAPLDGIISRTDLLLAAIDFDHTLLTRINQTFSALALIDGTTAGRLSSGLSFQQDSLALVLFAFVTLLGVG